MKLRALTLFMILLFTVSCSKKKKNTPSPVEEQSETTKKKQSSLETDMTSEGMNGDNTVEDTQDEVIDTEEEISVEKINDDEVEPSILPHPEVNEIDYDDKVENEEVSTTENNSAQTLPSRVVEYREDGVAHITPALESHWRKMYTKDSSAEFIVLEENEYPTNENEILIVRTKQSPEVVRIEMKAKTLLRQLTMTFDEYVDFLLFTGESCKEVYHSLYGLAEKYNMTIHSDSTYYNKECDCTLIKEEKAADVVDIFIEKKKSNWECPDNNISFTTCMDPDGLIDKYKKLTLNFKKAKTLSEGEYELYHVTLRQKKLGKRKLEFVVHPIKSHDNESLDTDYRLKQGGIFIDRDHVRIKKK